MLEIESGILCKHTQQGLVQLLMTFMTYTYAHESQLNVRFLAIFVLYSDSPFVILPSPLVSPAEIKWERGAYAHTHTY